MFWLKLIQTRWKFHLTLTVKMIPFNTSFHLSNLNHHSPFPFLLHPSCLQAKTAAAKKKSLKFSNIQNAISRPQLASCLPANCCQPFYWLPRWKKNINKNNKFHIGNARQSRKKNDCRNIFITVNTCLQGEPERKKKKKTNRYLRLPICNATACTTADTLLKVGSQAGQLTQRNMAKICLWWFGFPNFCTFPVLPVLSPPPIAAFGPGNVKISTLVGRRIDEFVFFLLFFQVGKEGSWWWQLWCQRSRTVRFNRWLFLDFLKEQNKTSLH